MQNDNFRPQKVLRLLLMTGRTFFSIISVFALSIKGDRRVRFCSMLATSSNSS